MAAKTTDRVVRIKAEDDVSSNILAIVRSMRSLATAIRQVRLLMIALNQLQKLEVIQVAALASAYRYLAIMKTAATMIGVGAAFLAIAASLAMIGSGAGPIPVAQTSSGGLGRRVSATGVAVVHADERITKDGGRGGGLGGGITIHIHEANMRLTQDIEETAENLGTLIYEAVRRRRY